MPFKSEKQRRFMYAKHMDIAERWEKEAEAERKKKKKPKNTVEKKEALGHRR